MTFQFSHVDENHNGDGDGDGDGSLPSSQISIVGYAAMASAILSLLGTLSIVITFLMEHFIRKKFTQSQNILIHQQQQQRNHVNAESAQVNINSLPKEHDGNHHENTICNDQNSPFSLSSSSIQSIHNNDNERDNDKGNDFDRHKNQTPSQSQSQSLPHNCHQSLLSSSTSPLASLSSPSESKSIAALTPLPLPPPDTLPPIITPITMDSLFHSLHYPLLDSSLSLPSDSDTDTDTEIDSDDTGEGEIDKEELYRKSKGNTQYHYDHKSKRFKGKGKGRRAMGNKNVKGKRRSDTSETNDFDDHKEDSHSFQGISSAVTVPSSSVPPPSVSSSFFSSPIDSPIYRYQNMIFYLSLPGIIDSLCYIFGRIAQQYEVFCFLQALLMQWSELVGIFYVCCMAIELKLIVTNHNGSNDGESNKLSLIAIAAAVEEDNRSDYKMMWKKFSLFVSQYKHFIYILFSYISSSIIILCVLFTHPHDPKPYPYDPNSSPPVFGVIPDPWCWIPVGYEATRFFSFYFLLILTIVFCAVVYLDVFCYLYKANIVNGDEESERDGRVQSSPSSSPSVLRSRFSKLLYYIIAYLLLYIWAILDRLYTYVTGDASFYLVLFHSICSPAMGFVNAMIWGFTNKRVRMVWRYTMGYDK